MKSSIIKLILLFFLLLCLQSCFTVFLTSAGISKDRKKSSVTYTVQSDELNRIDRGNLIEIFFVDGQVLKGRFRGLEAQYDYDLALIQTEKELLRIQSSEIEKIKVLKERKNGWIFATAGIAVDAILWANFFKDGIPIELDFSDR